MSKTKPQLPVWVGNLRKLMTDNGYNPRSLSLKAGLNATAVRDMLEGRSRFPRYDTAKALAEALNTTPAQLMSDEDSIRQDWNSGISNHDLELLTEIIAHLQEVTTELNRILSPEEFAAMATTLYHRLHNGESGGKGGLKPQIHDLLDYESLRQKRGRR